MKSPLRKARSISPGRRTLGAEKQLRKSPFIAFSGGTGSKLSTSNGIISTACTRLQAESGNFSTNFGGNRSARKATQPGRVPGWSVAVGNGKLRQSPIFQGESGNPGEVRVVVRITYRISPRPFASAPAGRHFRQHCHHRVLGHTTRTERHGRRRPLPENRARQVRANRGRVARPANRLPRRPPHGGLLSLVERPANSASPTRRRQTSATREPNAQAPAHRSFKANDPFRQDLSSQPSGRSTADAASASRKPPRSAVASAGEWRRGRVPSAAGIGSPPGGPAKSW